MAILDCCRNNSWSASACSPVSCLRPANQSLIVEGVTPTPVLTSVGFVNLGEDELETILDYAGHVAQFKEGGQEFEASQEALKEYLARWTTLMNGGQHG